MGHSEKTGMFLQCGNALARLLIFVLALSACTSFDARQEIGLDPEGDETVAQRIARHPDPWVLDSSDTGGNDSLNKYVTLNLQNRFFHLPVDALAAAHAPSVDGADPDCYASSSDGKKNYTLCYRRDDDWNVVEAAKNLVTQCDDNRAPSVSLRWYSVIRRPLTMRDCSLLAKATKANFFSFDRDARVCLAVAICASKKAAIERDRLIIYLGDGGGSGAGVAIGGTRPW